MNIRFLKKNNIQMLVMAFAIVLIMIYFTVMTDGSYISARNISNLFRQTAITGILAIGMVFIIISGEIDLSVGSMMGLLGGVAAILDVWFGWPLALTAITTIGLGLLFGLFNGWWVAYRKVPSFIVTLAGLLAFRGILIGITNGTTVAPTSNSMNVIGQSYLPNSVSFGILFLAMAIYLYWQQKRLSSQKAHGVEVKGAQSTFFSNAILIVVLVGAVYLFDSYRGIPTPVLLLIALMVAGMFIAKNTTFGRHVYAIGGNIEASRLSGINVEQRKLAIYGMNGLMVGIAALILTSRLGAGSPSAGNIAELDAIAACVIGGASMSGGVGTVFGAVIGAFIMAALDNGMSMMDVPTFWQYIVKGTILLLAVWMDSATKQTR